MGSRSSEFQTEDFGCLILICLSPDNEGYHASMLSLPERAILRPNSESPVISTSLHEAEGSAPLLFKTTFSS
jgi:hypothetical protein